MTNAAIFILGLGVLVEAYYLMTRKSDQEDFVQWGESLLTRGNLSVNAFTGTYMDKALALIANFEGFSSRAYPDPPNQTEKYSIGYGHQIVFGDGLDVNSIVTESQALSILANDAGSADACVASAVKVNLSDNQRAALISFCYNVGCGAFKSSTLLSRVNAGDFQGAANEFGRWIYSNGQIIQALVDRRAQERSEFLA